MSFVEASLFDIPADNIYLGWWGITFLSRRDFNDDLVNMFNGISMANRIYFHNEEDRKKFIFHYRLTVGELKITSPVNIYQKLQNT